MKMQPPADLDAVRASYDAVADNYVDMVGDPGPWPRSALDAFAEEVRGIGPVLDAGCGPGWISDYLHHKGVDIWGIDLSPRMIEHARQQYPAVSFEVASVTELDPEAGSLGGVLGWWSWFNLPRNYLPDVIATMARALRPGGQLIIGTHRGAGDHPRSRCYGDVPVEWTTHLYEPEELTTLLIAAGLEIVVDIRLPPLPPSQSPQLIVAAQRPPTA
ncbi:MAG: class I SAM-dependent methyltransferase [Microlunatus sp.]|nr:class I SAM-dependent methyltransferase [Microlunatus sp.]MDN5769736.1 class I SAM-dependent methyltransferase [Microlunatus sp.]